MALIDMDRILAKVTGQSIHQKKKKVEFNLTFREIKHIRRCMLAYLHLHPKFTKEDLEKDLSHTIYKKFAMFGRGKRRLTNMKKKMEDKPYVCAIDGCNENTKLTIAHIKPLSADGSNDKENVRWLCKRHHEIEELERLMHKKGFEMEKIERKLEELTKDDRNM